MARYIALIRGINVGGRTFPMAEVRAAVHSIGATDVTTYIQSGNVVLEHGGRAAAVRSALEMAFTAAAGFEVLVVMRTARDLERIIAANPFPQAAPTALHVGFMDGPVPAGTVLPDPARYAPEAYVVAEADVYLHLPHGMGRAKLPPKLALLKPPTTVRNWNTVLTLHSMATG
jgi:uncharacterized protein (DUF1697 family)